MASLSLDITGLMMIGVNYKESSYAPHARAAEIILDEEADHEIFAVGELQLRERSIASAPRRSPPGLREWLPRAVNFFGPPGSGFTYDCIRYGLKARDNGELAEMYLTMLERRLWAFCYPQYLRSDLKGHSMARSRHVARIEPLISSRIDRADSNRHLGLPARAGGALRRRPQAQRLPGRHFRPVRRIRSGLPRGRNRPGRAARDAASGARRR